MNSWIGVPEDISKYQAYVYIIRNLHTNKAYIGYKNYWKNIKRKPLKGTKRVRRDKIETDWKNYWGSCEKLKEDIKTLGKTHFSRRILINCRTKMEAQYEELRLQIEHGVLLSPMWYNDMIRVRMGGYMLRRAMKIE